MKYLGAEWFTGMLGLVGVVLVEGEAGDEDLQDGERGAYIGTAFGHSQAEDARLIMDVGCIMRGARFDVLAAHFASKERKPT